MKCSRYFFWVPYIDEFVGTYYDHPIQHSLPETIHQNFKAAHPKLRQNISNKNRRYCDCGHYKLCTQTFPLEHVLEVLHSKSEAAGATPLPRKAIIRMGQPESKVDDNGASIASPTIIKSRLQRLS